MSYPAKQLYQVYIEFSRRRGYKKSFFCQTIRLFNELPETNFPAVKNWRNLNQIPTLFLPPLLSNLRDLILSEKTQKIRLIWNTGILV